MKLESDTNFEEKLNCCLQNDMRNLARYDHSAESLKTGI